MSRANTKSKTEDVLLPVGNQSSRKTNASPSRYLYAPIIVVLVLVLSALCFMTLQSNWEMRRLERTVSDLELRLSQVENICRTRSENSCCDDEDNDDDDDIDVDVLSKLPAGTLVNSQIESPVNASDAATIDQSEGVAIAGGRLRRAPGPRNGKDKQDSTRDEKPTKKKKKGKAKAAHFHLNMPGSDTQFYQPVNEHLLSPWVDGHKKRHGFTMPYDFLPDNKGIKVTRKGLYLIYTQVTFHNNAPHNIGAIIVNGANVAQCTQSTHKMKVDAGSNGMFANCFTASVRFLEKGSNVQIKSLYRNRQILTRPKNTFFGLVKLA